MPKTATNKSSNWLNEAGSRIKNRKWLRYSSNIARRVLAAMEENSNVNQRALSAILDVTPQYISKLVKGQENLTLETIAKLSEALGVELITFPQYKYDEIRVKGFGNRSSNNKTNILIDTEPGNSSEYLGIISGKQSLSTYEIAA